jgi:hypothetical protein
MTARNDELLVAALELAAKGFRIVPLFNPAGDGRNCSCGKPNCDSPGKHPRVNEWPKAATTEAGIINAWWSKWRESNIGIATGPESGIFVIDADESHSLKKFIDIYGPLPLTLTAKSSRGEHFYFQHPGFKISTKSGLQKTAGIDVRGDAGLIVAAPSMHYTGQLYEWVDRAAQIAEGPSWLIELLKAESQTEGQKLTVIPSGKFFSHDRNRAVCEISISLYEKGNSREHIRRLMQSFNRRKCSPELEQTEVIRLIESAVNFVECSGSMEDRFKRQKDLLPWSQNRPGESLTNPQNFHDYQRGWLEYCRDHAWKNGGILPILPTDLDGLYRLARGTNRRKFTQEICRVLSDSGFKQEEFDDGCYWVHQDLAADWADAAVKWVNKSISSKFNKTRHKGSHSQNHIEAA